MPTLMKRFLLTWLNPSLLLPVSPTFEGGGAILFSILFHGNCGKPPSNHLSFMEWPYGWVFLTKTFSLYSQYMLSGWRLGDLQLLRFGLDNSPRACYFLQDVWCNIRLASFFHHYYALVGHRHRPNMLIFLLFGGSLHFCMRFSSWLWQQFWISAIKIRRFL